MASEGVKFSRQARHCVEAAVKECFRACELQWNVRAGLETLTVPHIDEQLASIQALRQLIDKTVLSTEIELKRMRNNRALIHQLPPELFVDILLRALDFETEWSFRRLHTFAQVSSVWSKTLKSSSLFWEYVSSGDPKDVQDQVLRKNTSGRINLVCRSNDPDDNQSTLLLALPHVNRWQEATFAGTLPSGFPSCLSIPTPQLANIYIYTPTRMQNESPVQVLLGEGRNLLIVDLDGASLSWNNSRLNGLQALSLRGLHGSLPTLSQLHFMLSCSTGTLWCLILSDLDAPRPDSSGSRDFPPIILQRLSKLQLINIPRDFTDFLLSVIVSPKPLCLHVDDTTTSSSNILLPKVLPLILPTAKRLVIRHEPDVQRLSLQTEPIRHLEDDWVYYASDDPGCDITLRSSSDWETLASWFAGISLPPARLVIEGRLAVPDDEMGFPTELLQSLHSLNSFYSNEIFNPGPILQYIADNGVCPNLKEVEVRSVKSELFNDAIIALADRRQPWVGAVNSTNRVEGVISIFATQAVIAKLEGLNGGQNVLYQAVD